MSSENLLDKANNKLYSVASKLNSFRGYLRDEYCRFNSLRDVELSDFADGERDALHYTMKKWDEIFKEEYENGIDSVNVEERKS